MSERGRRLLEKLDGPGAFFLLAPLLWLAVDPSGDFPLNDDWAYASPVRRLLAEGRLVLSDWSSPLALPPLALGALLAKLFGFHHAVLRVGTAFWSGLGGWFLWRILESYGVEKPVRRLAGFLYLFHPIFFVLTFTFHTDAPFAALALGAVYFLRRAEKSGRAADEWIASLFILGAALTRQIGLALAVSAGLWALYRRTLTPARALRFGLLPAAGTALCYAWFLNVHGPTWAHVNYVAGGTLKHLAAPAAFAAVTADRALGSLVYAGLFGAAFLFLRPAAAAARPRLGFDLLFAALGAALAVYLYKRGPLPYFENVFYPHGLGTLTVYDGRLKPAGFWSAGWLWKTYTLAGGLALWAAARRLFRERPSEDEKQALLYFAPLAAATLVGAKYFDRYLIEWNLAWIVWFAVRHARARVPAAAWVAAAFWAAMSLAGTRDYFAWNQAKWNLGLSAEQFGLAPKDVAAGFDWNAHWKYETNMAALKSRKKLEEIGEWEWETMEPVRAYVSFAPQTSAGPARATELYESPLSGEAAALHLHRAGP